LYGSGDTVNAAFRGSLRNGMVVPNQPITVEAEYGGRPIAIPGAAPGKPLQTTTDDYGKAAFHVPLPTTTPTAETLRIKVQAHDGKADPKVEAAIPILSQPAGILTVDLFPEGGDQVAGVPNRVYFRAVDHHNQPALLTGVLLDRQGRELVAVRGTEAGGVQGLGSFEFTPEAGETYTLRGRAPGTIETRVQLPPTRADGVALSVSQAVQREGQPLRVMVRDPRGRRLLVLAECRGRVVDQAFLTADKAGTEVTLTPVSGMRGVVRVTVVELSEGRLVPLAERLVYRTPAEYLQLTISDSTNKTPTAARAGEHLGLTVKVTNEKDAPTQASLLAAFVDRKWLGQRAEVTPPAQFYLSRPVSHPEDLADVDILFADTPQARQALDLFLATHGWRRFVPSGEPQRTDPSEKEVLAAMDAGQPAVFIADNRLEAVAEYQKKLASRQKALQDQAERQREELATVRDRKLEEAHSAAVALRNYEDLPRDYLWRGLVLVVLVLFALGSLGLALGVARTVRGGKSPRGSFAVAFIALFLCAGAYFWTMSLRDGQPEGGPLADLGKRELLPLDAGATGGRGEVALKQGEATSVRKLFALTSESKTVARRDAPATSGVSTVALEAGEKKAASAPLVAYSQGHTEQENGAADRQRNNPDYARRFTELQRTQQQGAPPVGTDPQTAKGGAALAPAPVAPTFVPSSTALPKHDGDAKTKAKGDSMRAAKSYLPLREYKHKQAAGVLDFQETLFWHPALEAKDGTARLEFDLSNNATTYQLLLYGHTSSGRLGVYRATVETHR
ncbi:MAG TPA: hypothetical protein VEL76_03755, partial [Gemmataceae bacterium]|nr:hypothetical protein [Gemmataceae bacterium]